MPHARLLSQTFIPVRIGKGVASIGMDLQIPETARGLVLFAHGSGGSRSGPRNQFVATRLRQNGFATCLMDLLTEHEEEIDAFTMEYRFNIPLLAARLSNATAWLLEREATRDLPIGYFGASTGAAAALIVAVMQEKAVRAIVSGGGRPEMAGTTLEMVKAPTLLIVGGHDLDVLALNREAFTRMHCEKAIEVVPSATHLFEEPGALEQVADYASQWFARYLPRPQNFRH